MEYATYKFSDSITIPATVSSNKHTTPVWIQKYWKDGEFANYIRKNGCGHCCTAMTLNLHGVSINPHEVYSLCRKNWGAPRLDEPYKEGHFLSVSGIVKVLSTFGIEAKCFGVPSDETSKVGEHIDNALCMGKQIIVWSHPSEKLTQNPFSTGNHYILLAGYTASGQILVANSSIRGETKCGVQLTDISTITKVLYENSNPKDYTWGRHEHENNSGYVIVE